MPRSLLVLPVLFAPVAAWAQEGPSFDCDDASTRTEFAICASPELSQLERQMVDSFNALSDVIGRSDARALADELLAERQACEGDPGCIADQLLVSTRIFDERSGRGTVVAAAPEPLPAEPLPTGTGVSPFDQAQLRELIQQAREARGQQELAAAEPPVAPVVPAPAPEVAATAPAPQAPAPAANPDIPLAAQAPLPSDLAAPEPTDLASAEPEATEPDLSDALDGAELTSSEGAVNPDAQAAFDTPLSWAFMDLDREQRIAVQERLAAAGFLEGGTEGAWTTATLAALERLAEEEGSGSFDLSTQSGGALLLDYVSSDAFTTAFGGADAAATPAATPPTPLDEGDPLAGTDW
jgi:hypothetical protein